MSKELDNLKRELKLLKDDILCSEIKEVKPYIPHAGLGKLDAKKHLLEHIEAIEHYLNYGVYNNEN